MHEQGLLARAAGPLLRGEPVREVRVAVGPRADREVIEASWAHLVAGTALETTVVTFTDATDPMVCLDCATEYEGSLPASCPACGGNGLPQVLAPDIDIVTVRR